MEAPTASSQVQSRELNMRALVLHGHEGNDTLPSIEQAAHLLLHVVIERANQVRVLDTKLSLKRSGLLYRTAIKHVAKAWIRFTPTTFCKMPQLISACWKSSTPIRLVNLWRRSSRASR